MRIVFKSQCPSPKLLAATYRGIGVNESDLFMCEVELNAHPSKGLDDQKPASKWHESVTDKSGNSGRVQFGLDSAEKPRKHKGSIPAQLPFTGTQDQSDVDGRVVLLPSTHHRSAG